MNLNYLKQVNEPIFYITNDVGRGIGLEDILPNYHIVCLDDHPLVNILEKNGVSVFCLERALGKKNIMARTSSAILSHPFVLSFIKEKASGKRPNILVFKPQKRVEILCKNHGFNLIGNSTEINRTFEDKISFFNLCKNYGLTVPEGEILENLSLANYGSLSEKYGETVVIQFGRGWAGNSTYFIKSEKELVRVKEIFSGRIKVSRFIKGTTILNNAVVYEDSILISKPALQVKADPRITSSSGGTGGRQWPVKLDGGQENMIGELTEKTGRIMREKGYKGFFGLDFLAEENTGKIFLSENNARLTASVPFYTKLELKSGYFPLLGYHLLSFFPELKIKPSLGEPAAVFGGEIVVRNNQAFSVKADGCFNPGIYDKKLNFVKELPYLMTQNYNDLWINAIAQGRIANPEIEIIKLNTFSEICEKNGVLKNEYFDIVEEIRKKLALKQC